MNLFEIIGPVMIGPSSSHTAGAVRIGLVGRKLLGEEVLRARIELHGSFAETYRGHGTDRALVAGLMGMAVDDARIRDALTIARERGMEYAFEPVEFEDAHPNTAQLTLTGASGARACVRASSVGGGAIRVDRIDALAVSFRVSGDTIVVRHTDRPGAIARVSGIIAGHRVNIATMQVFRASEGGDAVMAIEVDGDVPKALREALREVEDVSKVAYIEGF
ncbi:MAG: L-serine ammonia-lyase, iron-sulfur-dependent subunit beta [Christensenellales bacterium]|jgi:L-serine dehydratase